MKIVEVNAQGLILQQTLFLKKPKIYGVFLVYYEKYRNKETVLICSLYSLANINILECMITI